MKRTRILFAVAILFVMASCGKKVDVALNSTALNLAAEGETVEVGLTSNGDWTIDDYPEWLTVSPVSGNGNATLTLVAPLNDSDATRMGELHVSTKDNSAKLVVSQDAMEEDFIIVQPQSIECEAEGGEFTLTVTSNCDWNVNVPVNWLTCEPMSGTGNGTVTVSIRPMDGDVQIRETNIVFSGVVGELLPIHVQQHAPVVFYISVNPSSIGCSYEAAEYPITVSCESSWTASVDADWVTLSANSGDGNADLTVIVAENEAMEVRVANVTFVSETENTAILVVKQEEAPDPHYLEVTPEMVEIGKDGGSADIAVSCDREWTASVQDAWVTLSATSGTGDGSFALTVGPNPFSEPRQTAITVVSDALTQRVTVIQEAGEVPISMSVTPDTLFVGYSGGFKHFSLTANVSWSIATSDNWITLQNTSGTGDAEITIIVDFNGLSAERVGVINVMHNSSVICSVIVVQEGRPSTLETDITEINAPSEGGNYTIKITSNQTWHIETSADWLACTPSSGDGNGEFLVKIIPLTSAHSRSTEIHIYGSFGSSLVIPVTQTN